MNARLVLMRRLATTAATAALVAGSLLAPAIARATAPDNDYFATATQVAAIPFSNTYSLAQASFEPGEPTPTCSATMGQSVWFDYTPETSGLLAANSGNYYGNVAVYTGNEVAALTQIGCSNGYYWPAYFVATAGVAYHFQISNGYYVDANGTFTLTVAPAPQLAVWLIPYDPSMYDTVTFTSSVYDPANQPITSMVWDFGDGLTATGRQTSHRYASDGDYAASFVATTADGRTATWRQTVSVRTHDVAIAKFNVPTVAAAGQTRQISVALVNRRMDEWVTVVLARGTPSGIQTIGTQTIFVPARSTRTTTVTFSYTFTRDDAALGKVTFDAQAMINGARDALPADNEAIATTKVTR